MDLRLPSISLPATPRSVGGIKNPAANHLPVGGQASGERVGFSTALKNALQTVSAAQNQSTALQQEVQLENPKVSLEETMLAIQKAQIGFQATVTVRNKMVQAYTDIMNMQV